MPHDSFAEIKETLGKIILAINNDEKLQKMVCFGQTMKPNVEYLERASGNHIFTDYHKLFGIKEIDGAKIRDYIQQQADGPYSHVITIRENFYELLSNEDPKWLKDYVNESRIKKSLKPISPSYPK
jgi:hypothetical protein